MNKTSSYYLAHDSLFFTLMASAADTEGSLHDTRYYVVEGPLDDVCCYEPVDPIRSGKPI